jgi:orotate phosphoribosyltransferase
LSKKKRNETVKDEICKILNQIGALKFGTFQLTSGKISPYYIDLRVVPSFPGAWKKTCDFQANFIKSKIGLDNLDRIAGIPIGGMAFASLVAYRLEKPFLYIRKGVRLHGRQRRVEGILTPGDQVLLIDDLITSGSSLRKAAKLVEAEGGVVKDAVVFIDREEGGEENLQKDGIRLHSLLKISGIAERLHEIGAIDEEQMKTILAQINKKG